MIYYKVNEISDYQKLMLSINISINEAAWRILEFLIDKRNPSAQQLSVNLENGQHINCTTDSDPLKTTLTEFFALCQVYDFARTLDVPKYFMHGVWNRINQGI